MPSYNNYTPYQPYSSYQVYQPQQQQQYQQQPVQQVQNTASIIWIANEKEAAMYPVAPNNAVTLWNQNEPVIYLKQADATGRPTLKVFDLVERPEAQPEQKGTQDTYATKQELAAVAGVVKDLNEIIESLREEVKTLKDKPVKKIAVKKEANEDE